MFGVYQTYSHMQFASMKTCEFSNKIRFLKLFSEEMLVIKLNTLPCRVLALEWWPLFYFWTWKQMKMIQEIKRNTFLMKAT